MHQVSDLMRWILLSTRLRDYTSYEKDTKRRRIIFLIENCTKPGSVSHIYNAIRSLHGAAVGTWQLATSSCSTFANVNPPSILYLITLLLVLWWNRQGNLQWLTAHVNISSSKICLPRRLGIPLVVYITELIATTRLI